MTIAIVGGGCAGLSLGSALAARGITATIFEPRNEYVSDRTWCFWNVQPHRFEAAITHRWAHWAVRHRGQTVVRSAPGLEYVHVDGGKFYDRARQASLDLRLGARVISIVDTGSSARVTTSSGTHELDHVYDTRPPRFEAAPARNEIRLLQHFRGAFVRTEVPVFETSTATLMDFDVPQDRGISFVYVLPFSSTEALVEATWFSTSVHDASIYDELLERWRKERLGLDRWTVLRTEQGVLPMTTERLAAAPGARVQRLGVGGGAAKPSTGYAFLAIQRQVDALAERIAHGAYDVPAARGAAALAMDRVMLDWMTRHPSDAPALFLRLFERVDPVTLARFLSEKSSARDDFAIMRVAPMREFTASTARASLSLLHRRLTKS